MSKITKVLAREIFTSRGNPTIQVEVYTEFDFKGVASVPSGASTGEHEACELIDRDVKDLALSIKDRWYGQKGVITAVNNVNNIIAKAIIGMEVSDQKEIDRFMINLDGTKNKSKLGANAILGVSLAIAKAAANELSMPLYRYIGGINACTLPLPMINIMNGGAHASNTLDFQEFMIMPFGVPTFTDALRAANKIFHTLEELLRNDGKGTQIGDEGGFAPNLSNHEEALQYIVKAIKKAGYVPARNGENAVAIAMDCASSELYDKKTGKYYFKKQLAAGIVTEDGVGPKKGVYTTDELVEYLKDLTLKYPILSIEDPLQENDWDGFQKITKLIGKKVLIVGDDLFVTNTKFIKKGIKLEAATATLIKPNQIGTLTETLESCELSLKAGLPIIISHRSGETEDNTIADLAVAYNSGLIKTGSFSRTDRMSKYNRLMAIRDELGKNAIFLGRDILRLEE